MLYKVINRVTRITPQQLQNESYLWLLKAGVDLRSWNTVGKSQEKKCGEKEMREEHTGFHKKRNY